jgi:hypothetical protein
VVHDLYIHERLGRLPGARSRYVRWVAAAHAVHHRSGREPYGFLLPRLATASTISSTSNGPATHWSSQRQIDALDDVQVAVRHPE